MQCAQHSHVHIRHVGDRAGQHLAGVVGFAECVEQDQRAAEIMVAGVVVQGDDRPRPRRRARRARRSRSLETQALRGIELIACSA